MNVLLQIPQRVSSRPEISAGSLCSLLPSGADCVGSWTKARVFNYFETKGHRSKVGFALFIT